MSRTKYAVAMSTFGDEIKVGALSRDGSYFLDKNENCTAMVIAAVADWATRRYEGAATVKLPDGREVDIEVRP